MPKSMMAKADFITAIVFFLLGVYMVSEGLKMPGAGGFIEKGGEPGRVPVLLGAIIAAFAAILLIRSVVAGGHRLGELMAAGPENRVGLVRGIATAVGCSVYAVGLVGAHIAGWKVPYSLVTGLFVFGFIAAFEWQDAAEAGTRRWEWLCRRLPVVANRLQAAFGFLAPRDAAYVWLLFTAGLQAVIVAAAVTYLFEQQFYVTLP
jgi:hypothetical protein